MLMITFCRWLVKVLDKTRMTLVEYMEGGEYDSIVPKEGDECTIRYSAGG